MRQIFIFTLLVIVSISSRAQQIDPYTLEPASNKYDPINKTAKDNHIKYVIDSSEFIIPGKCRTMIYDSLGRLAGELRHPGGNLINTFVYKTNGDTTWRLNYDTGKTVLYSFQRFVLNKKGQIISYLDCGNYYIRDESYYVGYEAFYYDDKDRLQTKHTYTQENYPGKVSIAAIIKPTELNLDDVINYTYSTLKNNNKLVIGKHTIGKPDWRSIDSTLYDKQNRIIRFNSFAKTGTIGEQIGNNVNNIALFQYEGNTIKVTRYTTYCYVPENNHECFQTAETDRQTILILYNADKTLKAKYGYNSSGQQYLADKFEYTYY